MARKKPEKPYRDFPLFAHGNGQWAKKIRGRLYYFGAWDDAESAYNKYLDEREDLQAGRQPVDEGLRLWQLCDLFLQAKRQLVETEELSLSTWQTYHGMVKTLLKHCGRETRVSGMGPADFEDLRGKLAKTRKAVSLGNEIQRVRTLFKYGYDAGHLTTPVRFGPHFRRPAKRIVRAAKNANGKRMFRASEIRKILYSDRTRLQLRAMTLLGINCAFGQSDIASLPIAAIQDGFVEFPRPKTAVQRRCPLWPETLEAIQAVLEKRPKPRRPEYEHLLFLTRLGQPWVRHTEKWTDDNISKEFTALLKELGIKRPGIAFYALRHGFETIGGEAKDQVAVDWIMGHADQSMAGNYRHGVSDERLQAVVDVVYRWLFPRPWVG